MKETAEAYSQKLKMIKDEFLIALQKREPTEEIKFYIHCLKHIESPFLDAIIASYIKNRDIANYKFN